jgi:hypothetical protein
MLFLLGMLMVYGIACLPGWMYALEKIDGGKPLTRFVLHDGTRIQQYLDFPQIWYATVFEAIKVVLFLALFTAQNPWLILAFLLGVLAPFWRPLPFRELSLFVFFYLLAAQFSIGVLFGLVYVVATVLRQPFKPFLGAVFCLVAGLFQWVAGVDLPVVGLTLLVLSLEIIRLASPWVIGSRRLKAPNK